MLSLTSIAPFPRLLFPFPLLLFDGIASEALPGSTQGIVLFCVVGLTGAGATVAVKLGFRPDSMKTGSAYKPIADVFGTTKGTYSPELSGLRIAPVAFVRVLDIETFVIA